MDTLHIVRIHLLGSFNGNREQQLLHVHDKGPIAVSDTQQDLPTCSLAEISK